MSRKPKNWRTTLFFPILIFALAGLFVLQSSAVVGAVEGKVKTPEAGKTAPQLDLSPYFPTWMQYEFLGVAIWQFLAAFVFILLGLVLKKVSDYVFEKRLIPMLERTRFAFDSLFATAASKPLGFLFFVGGLAGALAVLQFPKEPNIRGFLFGAIKVLVGVDVLWFLFRAIDVGVQYLAGLARRTQSRLDDQLIPLIRKALKVSIGVVIFLWVIQLLGYSVSSLLAGLGIGGLAVALALQDPLANFFGSVFLFVDRPFAVGDWIKVGDVEGTVEDIGFRTTRIRTWPATLVSIPNKTVANATIDNWSKMSKRRVTQTVGVTYQTSADQMQQAVAAIRQIVENDQGVDKDFIVIRFTDFGDSSLNILLYYFTRDIPFADHLATKERINLAVMRALEKLGLSIAFPTHTVYLEGETAKKMAQQLSTGTGKSNPQTKSGPALRRPNQDEEKGTPRH
jgi:MscS family membrane protein